MSLELYAPKFISAISFCNLCTVALWHGMAEKCPAPEKSTLVCFQEIDSAPPGSMAPRLSLPSLHPTCVVLSVTGCHSSSLANRTSHPAVLGTSSHCRVARQNTGPITACPLVKPLLPIQHSKFHPPGAGAPRLFPPHIPPQALAPATLTPHWSLDFRSVFFSPGLC